MYKVIRNFTDKYTKAKYKVGDVIELTDKRAKEILSVGELIELVETTEEVVETPKKSKRKRAE